MFMIKRIISCSLFLLSLLSPGYSATSSAFDIMIEMQNVRLEDDPQDPASDTYILASPSIQLKSQQGAISSRPITLREFVAMWHKKNAPKDSFEKIPPNAYLTFRQGQQNFKTSFIIKDVKEAGSDLRLKTIPLPTNEAYKKNDQVITRSEFKEHMNGSKKDIVLMVDSIWDDVMHVLNP